MGSELISIRDLIAYRMLRGLTVERVRINMPTAYGHFRLIPFRHKTTGLEHIALIKAWRRTSRCWCAYTRRALPAIFASRRCDCGEQLHRSIQAIRRAGRGWCSI